MSVLRQGVKIDANNQFLKSYDKNNNSIFDNEELSQLYSDLEPLVNDGELDKNESVSLLAKVLNTSVEAIKERFSNQESNDVFEGLETLYSNSVQKDVLDHKTSEIRQAMELYEQARGGKVSDTIHGIFNPDYISDKVYRQLAREQVSVLLLHDAEGGNLTMKKYLERKIEFLECYLGKNNLNEKDKEFLTRGIRQLTPQELNNLIDKLTDCDDSEFQQIVNQTISDLKNKGEKASNPNKSREIGFNQSANPNSIESILNSSDSEKIVDYENTFKIEYGLEFDEENIQNYYDKKSEFETVSRIHNKIATQYNSLDEAIKSNNSEDLKESIRNALAPRTHAVALRPQGLFHLERRARTQNARQADERAVDRPVRRDLSHERPARPRHGRRPLRLLGDAAGKPPPRPRRLPLRPRCAHPDRASRQILEKALRRRHRGRHGPERRADGGRQLWLWRRATARQLHGDG